MNPKTKSLVGLAGLGLGAVCAGPAGAALGSTIGPLLGQALEPWLEEIGKAAAGIAGNLFAARLDDEPYSGFNDDLRRALGRALQHSLGADAVRDRVLDLAVYDSVVGLQKKSLKRYFEVWDRELARINVAAEKGDSAELAQLFPNWDETRTVQLTEEGRTLADGAAEWRSLIGNILFPLLEDLGAEWLPPSELSDKGVALRQSLSEALAAEFPHSFSEEIKSPEGRRAWIAFQKLLLVRLDRQVGAIAETTTATSTAIAALRAEISLLTSGARDAAADEKQQIFFAGVDQSFAKLSAQIAQESERTREHVTAAAAGLGQKIDAGNAVTNENLATLSTQVGQLIASQQTAIGADICTLPSVPNPFVGREDDLRKLQAQAERGEGVAIVGLRGMGGVGKTGLALVLAHRMRPRYSAALYLNLQGLGDPADPNPINRPLPREVILTSLLRALKVGEVDQIDPAAPGGWDQLRGLYCAVLGARPVLLLLDNAANAAQVAPALPPAGCLLIATSREAFILHGVTASRLGTLTQPESERLLRELCPRLSAEEAAKLAVPCACLPKALRAAAGRLAVEEDLAVGDYLRLLGDEKTRLRHLGHEDGDDLDVEATLRLSIQRLSDTGRRAFAMLAIFGSRRFPLAAASHVIRDPKRQMMSSFYRLSLVEWDSSSERYYVHDHLRLLAVGELNCEDEVAANHRFDEWKRALQQSGHWLKNSRVKHAAAIRYEPSSMLSKIVLPSEKQPRTQLEILAHEYLLNLINLRSINRSREIAVGKTNSS